MCSGRILKRTKIVVQRRGREFKVKDATTEYLACTEILRLESRVSGKVASVVCWRGN
jgi:hypothetical protein